MDRLFGFPRREIAVPGVQREIAVLPQLAAQALAISLAASLAKYAAADGRGARLRECLVGLSRTVAA